MKKGIVNRFLSMLLVLVMVMSVVPMNAMALGLGDIDLGNVEPTSSPVDPNAYVEGDIGVVAGVKLAGTTMEGVVEMYLPLSYVVKMICEEADKALGRTEPIYDQYKYEIESGAKPYPADGNIDAAILNQVQTNLEDAHKSALDMYNNPLCPSNMKEYLENSLAALQDAIDKIAAAEALLVELYAATTPEEMAAVMGEIDATMGTGVGGMIVPYLGMFDGMVSKTVVNVLGYNVAEETGLSVLTEIGMYFVADAVNGLNPAPIVIAPEVLGEDDVKILINGQDLRFAAQINYGAPYTVDVTIDGQPATQHVKTMYVGMDTTLDGWCREEQPENPGAYMVVALYVDMDSRKLGADVCALAIKPAHADFELADYAVDYDGNQHFAKFTAGEGFQKITVAAGEGAVYVNYTPELLEYAKKLTAIGNDKAGETAENVIAKIPSNTLQTVLGYLVSTLDKAATKVEGFDGVGDVYGSTLKTEFAKYVAEAKAFDVTGNVMDAAHNAVVKAEQLVEENEGLLPFLGMIGAALGADIDGLEDIDADAVVSKLVNYILQNTDLSAADVKEDAKEMLNTVLAQVAEYGYNQQAYDALATLAHVCGLSGNAVETILRNVESAGEDMVLAVADDLAAGDIEPAVKKIETYLDTVVLEAALTIVGMADDNLVIHVGRNPVGNPDKDCVYECYAVNVSTNFMPNPTVGTLTIKAEDVPVHTHSYTAAVTAPTCTEQGYTTYSCTCGDSYVADYVDALEHSWSVTYTNNGDDHTVNYVCENDNTHNDSKVEAHTYENGVCICGAVEPTELFDITKTNVIMGENLALLFAFEKSNITDADLSDYVAKVSVEYKDARGTVNSEVSAADWETVRIGGVDYWMVTVPNLAAKEMDDDVTVTIYKGDDAVSNPKTMSLRQYAEERLAASQSDLFKTVVVDMLNYGAEAQEYFKYNTANPANRNISEYQNLATKTEDVILDKQREILSDANNHFIASSVKFESDIVMMFAVARDSAAVSGKITFTNHLNKEVVTVVDTFTNIRANGKEAKMFEFTGMVVADIDQIITVEFFDENGNLVLSLTDSLDAYLGRVKTSSTMYNLAGAFGKFSTSAHVYLHSK